MAFMLPEINYTYDALEPYIDAETMRIHHGKHHAAYVANLNKAIEGGEFESWPLEALVRDYPKLPAAIATTVRNNGGGHYNHSLFWSLIAPPAAGAPSKSLAAAIGRDLGGYDTFKAELAKAAMSRFGSGWAWLGLKQGKLAILSTPNQDNPLMEGIEPLLGIDVWEHAYYLKYQNRRADYVEAFFKVIDWKAVGERFEMAMG